jgi:hypothetical protein
MAEAFEPLTICLDHPLIDEGGFLFQPGKECRTEIETEGGVIVVNIEDPAVAIDHPSVGIGTITFKGNSLIPIVKRMGALFGFNGFEPGILAGRLVEVAMNRHKCIFHLSWIP